MSGRSPRLRGHWRVAVVVLCAACRDGRPASDVPAVAAPRVTDTVASIDSTTAAGPGDRNVAGVGVALDGEGLRLIVLATGATRLLPFGTGVADMNAALIAPLGAPIARGTNADCGAGAMGVVSFRGGLSVLVQRERFVGWAARADTGSARVTTMSGVGVGATRALLDSVYSATVSRTSLGEEFSAAELHGVLDGAGSSARITDMWAGASCVAR